MWPKSIKMFSEIKIQKQNLIQIIFILICLVIINKVDSYNYNSNNNNNIFNATTPITPTDAHPYYENFLLNNNNNYNNKNNNKNSKNKINNQQGENLTQLNDRVYEKKKLNNNNYNFLNVKRTNNNNTLRETLTGNTLWDGVIFDCLRKPTFSCFQKNVYDYLDDTLSLHDVNVTNRILFKKNQIDYNKYTKEANQVNNNDDGEDNDDDDNNDIPDIQARSETPIEEVTNSLYGKGVKFMMTHDLELKMPEMLFDGSTFRVSPRSIEGNGAIVKIEFLPKGDNQQTGRIFFKKIKKFFKNKLLLSFLAIVLVIKLIKIKIFWLLPLIVGVTTAKKLVLKFLLFLFPALSQIFKLCSWYHQSYHQTKYHHHQHHINHLHTILPQWHNDHEHHDHHHAASPYGAEVVYSHPPKGHPAEYIHGAQSPPHQYQQGDWEFSGPGLGSEYIGDIHRNAQINSNFKPKLDDVNEINSWGLGTTFAPISSHSYNTNPLIQQDPLRLNQKAQANSLNPVYVNPQQQRQPNAAQIAAQYNNNHGVETQMIREAQRLQAQEALRIQQEQKLIAQQQKILQQQPFVQDTQTMNHIVDPFYSPILLKMDKVFQQLGFNDEACRERLVCSMYKFPTRYSPHSNYISAELSRDSSELQKPQNSNVAVIRFYRYVQAARDGQDQRECLRLYPHCAISTE